MRQFLAPTACGLALTLLACRPEAAAGPDDDFWLTENRGTPLGAINLQVSPGIHWARSDEIVYVSHNPVGGERHLRATHVADGADRVIDGPLTGASAYRGVRVSPRGRDVYFQRSETNTSGALYASIDGALPMTLARSTPLSGANAFSYHGSAVAVSSDGRYAAFVVVPGDSVHVFDADVGTVRHLATGCRALLVFSPDNRELLCQLAGAATVLSLADGSRRAITLPSSVTNHWPSAATWTPDGLQFVYSGTHALTEVVNTATNRRDTIFRLPSLPVNRSLRPELEAMAWSPDGTRLALPIVRSCSACRDRTGVQTELTIHDLRVKRSTRVAVIDGPISQVVFSPDGTRLAYLAEPSAGPRMFVLTSP